MHLLRLTQIFPCAHRSRFLLCLLMPGMLLLSLRGDARQATRHSHTSTRQPISHIYIADRNSDCVVRLNGFSAKNWTSYGRRPKDRSRSDASEGSFDSVSSVAVDSQERIYIADQGHQRLCRVDDMKGRNWVSFSLKGCPESVFVTEAGRIYVLLTVGSVGGSRHIVRMDDMTGRGRVDLRLSDGSGRMQLSTPIALFVDRQEHIYIADSGNFRIVRMDDMQGNGWVTLGSQGIGMLQFRYPTGVFVDTNGQIYITDQSLRGIVRVDDMSGKGWTEFDGAKHKGFRATQGIWIGKDHRIYFTEFIQDYGSKVVRMDNISGDHLSLLEVPIGGNSGAIVVR
jgi:streptogramin lyase